MKKEEQDLVLEGFKHRITFSEVSRVNTQKRIDGGHDCRETEKAYEWKGTIEIHTFYTGQSIEARFETEAFWPNQVKNLTLGDILFLCVRGCLYAIEFRSEKTKKFTIDYFAERLLLRKSPPKGQEQKEANYTYSIRPFDLRYHEKDKVLVESGFISHYALKPKPGVPGKIEQEKPMSQHDLIISEGYRAHC